MHRNGDAFVTVNGKVSSGVVFISEHGYVALGCLSKPCG